MCDGKQQQQQKTMNGSKPPTAPRILQFWISLQNALPDIRLFGLNISLTLLSAVILSLVRFTAEYFMVTIWNWPSNTSMTKVTASSVSSIIHSLLLVPSLGACLLSHKYHPTESLAAAPVYYQEAVTALFQVCTGYMLYDGVLNLLWCKMTMPDAEYGVDDYNFIMHHIACILYMTSCRITTAGHQSAMMCMFWGEMTNPLHNAYYINLHALQQDCCNGETSQAFFQVIEFIFGLIYVLVRGLVAPPVFAHCTWFLFFRRNKLLPFWLISLWAFLVWAIILGSVPYIFDCWNMVEKNLPEALLSALGRSSTITGDEL